MNAIIQDLRFAARGFVKSPGFTAVAVVTLALGIGATTAIFSVVDTLMLRKLPYDGADRIVTLWRNDARQGLERDDVAPGNFVDWRERSQVFEHLGAIEPYSFDLTGDGAPEVLYSALVTEGFFDAFALRPYLGRLFGPDDFAASDRTSGFAISPAVVILSYNLWRNRFGGDSSLVGRTLLLDGSQAEVVGILPPEFELGMLETAGERGAWAPRALTDDVRQVRGSAWWNVVGRLRPGVALTQARAELDRVATLLQQEYPVTNEGIGVSVVPLHAHLVGNARTALLVLLGAVALVLLIACVNVANLLLARGAERQREFAIRAALGAGRLQLVRQLFAESLLLAAVGCGVGVLFAFWGVDLIKALSPGNVPRMATVAVDLRIVGFAAGLAVLTAVVFGLVPAAQFSRPDLQDAMQEGRTTAGTRRARLRGALIATEVAVALALLIGAGLLLRSFVVILKVDPGFVRENVLVAQVFAHDRPRDQRIAFFEQTIERIEALPGVRSAGAVSAAPFLPANIGIQRPFTIEGHAVPREGEEPRTYVTVATPGYFATVGLPLRRGRLLQRFDRDSAPPVAVISETMARRFWGADDPLGARIRISGGDPIEVVGIVGDVRHEGLDAEPRSELYFPHAMSGFGSMTYFVRAERDPLSLVDGVKDQVWALSPLQTFYQTATLEGLVSDSLAERRFSLVLLGSFALIALILSGVGIYGVVSFSVSRRTREVGIRIALGADRSSVLRLVVGQGMKLTLLGAGVGVLGALAGARVLSSLLYGIPPRDGLAFSAATVVLIGVALLACYLPARRATTVDPMVALRYE